MPKTVNQFLHDILESSPEAQFVQNKRHHGNTKLELESAPHKVAKRDYRGPIKKVPTVVKEGDVDEGLERYLTKKGRIHKGAADILKSIKHKRKVEQEKTQKEDFSLKPKSPEEKMARGVYSNRRKPSMKTTLNHLVAQGKVHTVAGKIKKGPEPK